MTILALSKKGAPIKPFAKRTARRRQTLRWVFCNQRKVAQRSLRRIYPHLMGNQTSAAATSRRFGAPCETRVASQQSNGTNPGPDGQA